MKEDAQLICPISFHDPSGCVWSVLQQSITERLPLRDISWKSTGAVSLSQGCVERLPLRFMPSTASLFKDTDHPFRWFLAPYGNIYFVNIDSIDAYKDAKLAVKKWVESVVGLKRASWLLVFAPVSATGKAADAVICGKIYAKLCSDFYVERVGDRCVNFSNVTITSISTDLNVATAYEDFFSKVKEGVIASFFQRSALYDSDIRRLDSFRGSPQFDFRQLFLVKESLALMYQLMQLPQEALRQYGELEALLGVVPEGTLPRDDWPLVVLEDVRTNQKSTSSTPTPQPSSVEGAPDEEADTSQSDFDLLWKDPLIEGESVLLYSINSARMRILKNKIGLRELRRYVFSRQMHFLAQQRRCCEFASKGVQFVSDTYSSILLQLAVESEVDHHRRQQADLWAVCAAVKIVRTCRLHLSSQSQHESRSPKSDPQISISPIKTTEGEDSPHSPPLSSVPMEAEGTTDAVEAVEAVLRKKLALSRELHLLQEAAIPLSDLLHLALGSLHSLCMSLSYPQPQLSMAYKKSSYYRERALAIALSLNSSEDSVYGTWRCAAPAGTEAADNLTALAMIKGRVIVVDEAHSALVEEALVSDLDKGLSIFPSHLRMVLSSSKVKGDGDGDGAEGQVDPTASLTQWCPLRVLLHRTIGAHEELAGRNRTAGRSMLNCGDVLLCHDYFALASACYSQGLSRERTAATQRQRLEGIGCWEDVERVSLLKVLSCAASIADRGAYMHTALSLHALRSKRESSLTVSSESHSSLSVDPDDFKDDARTLEPEGVFPLLTYFEVNGDGSAKVHDMSGAEMLTDEMADLQLSSLPCDIKTLRPDVCCTLQVSIRSLFPCVVEVDEVSVLYESRATIADSTLPARLFTAVTTPAQEVNSITLHPAMQKILSLSFVAPSSTTEDYGDFHASEVRVLFRDSIGGDDMMCFLLRRTQNEEDALLDADIPPSATDDTIGSGVQSLCRLPVFKIASPHSGLGLNPGHADSAQNPLPQAPTRAAEICVCASLPTPPIQLPAVIGSSAAGLLSKGSFQFVLQVELKNASASQRRMLGFRIRDSLYDSSDLIDCDSNKIHGSNARDTFPAIAVVESIFELSLIDSFSPSAAKSSGAVGVDEGSFRSKPAPHGFSGHPVILLPGDCCCVTLALSMVPLTPSSPERRGTATSSELGLDSTGQHREPSIVFSFDAGGEGQASSPRERERASMFGAPSDLFVSLAPSCQWMTRRLSLVGSSLMNNAIWAESLLAKSAHTPATETAASSSTYNNHTVRNRSSEESGLVFGIPKEKGGEGSSSQHTGEAPHRRSRSVHNRDLMQRVLTKAIKVERPLSIAP